MQKDMDKDFSQYKIKEWDDKNSVRNMARRKGTVAPSKAELNFYKKHCAAIARRVKSPRMLVLGPTPEIRDIGLRLGFKVTAVDMNKRILDLMKPFLRVKDRSGETVMLDNWLAVPLLKNNFDVVIGDVSFNNLAAKDIPFMFKRVHGWMKSGGFFILRNIVLPDRRADFGDFNRSIELWRRRRIKTREFYFRWRFLHSYPGCFNKKLKIFEAAREFKWLDEMHWEGVFNKKEYGELNKARNVILHIVLPLKQFLKLFNKYFATVEISAEVPEKFGFYPVKLFCGIKN